MNDETDPIGLDQDIEPAAEDTDQVKGGVSLSVLGIEVAAKAKEATNTPPNPSQSSAFGHDLGVLQQVDSAL
jgi:hypothetical protein